jgi:hypothetical protein
VCINAKKEGEFANLLKCQTQLPNCWIGDFESFGKKTRMPNLFAKLLKLLINRVDNLPSGVKDQVFSHI